MAHDAFDPRFRALIDEHAPVRQLGSGFSFVEGPIWHPTEHHLLFSDMPEDVRRRWDRAGVREVERPSRKGNGMTYDADLNLLVCEHATSSVVRIDPRGERAVLASHFEGRELNSPNDLVVHSSGAIYFTDPWYGRMPRFGVERPRDLGFQGVYRIPPSGGAPQLLVDRLMFGQPNGLCFGPGEDRLYVNDTEQANIRVFRVEKDGSLSKLSPLCFRNQGQSQARRAGRHEVRPRGQHMGDRTGRGVGLRPGRSPYRQGQRARTGREPALGRPGVADAVPRGQHVSLRGRHQDGGAAGALHEACGATMRTDKRDTPDTIVWPRSRCITLCARHSGHAERR